MSTCQLKNFSTIPYFNFAVYRGYDLTFIVEALDRSTGQPYDLTGCTAYLTACKVGSTTPAFVLTDTDGQIVIGGTTGEIEITVPGAKTEGVTDEQLAYDIVVVDPLSVKLSISRGIVTLNPVA
jgi:hypothetical protein